MAAWQRCETCRKVLPAEAFDGDSATCRSCLTAPAPKVRAAKAGPVTRTRTAPAPPAPPAGPRPALLGVAGSGDLEVRERRARRAAQESLAHAHPQEYAELLRSARAAEGLRA